MPNNEQNISTLADSIKFGVNEILKNLHTCTPGIVESFDASTQLATIQPALKRIFKETQEEGDDILVEENLPKLINVPVIFPRGGGYSLTFPVKEGDECLILFCERAIDGWHQFGTVRKPNGRRFHSLTDAVAIVGLSSKPNKVPNYNADYTELKSDNESVIVTIQNDGEAKVYADTKITLDSPDVLITGNLTVEGDSILSETVTSNGKDISDTHTHTGSPTAPTGAQSNTGTPL